MSSASRYYSLVRQVPSMATDLIRAVRLVFSTTPYWTTIGILFVFVLGFLPLISLVIIKILVDTVTAGIINPDQAVFTPQIILMLCAAAGVALITALCNAGSTYANEVQALVMTEKISGMIQSQSLALDLEYYENAEYLDTLHRAQEEGPMRPALIVNDLVRIGQNCVSVTVIGALLLSFSPLVGIGLVCATIPAAAFRVWFSNKRYILQQRQTELERRNWYYHMMLTNTDFAKEVRLYGLGPFFQDRYRKIQKELRTTRLALSRSRIFWDVLAQGIVTVAIFGSLSIIVLMTLQGELSPGDMVMYLVGFQLCIGYIQSIFGSITSLYEDQLFLRNLFAFLDLKPRIVCPPDPVTLPGRMQDAVRMEGISFTYPGEQYPALSDVSLTLHKGEVIALVGENGAGKSTLIKILSRLYTPHKGSITVDGLSLAGMDPAAWREHITVLFQDYVHYDLTAQENISLGEIRGTHDFTEVEQAARMAGADEAIQRLPGGYQTILGNFFHNGHELSIGEWQKIALARAFFREADIIVLDEPASSLDALAEAEIFDRFRQIIKGRSAILISHRFSTLRMADHIYVLERGTIIEHGNHASLMAQNGHYATMFRAQADPYRD
ncbi:MAG: ABC transporter ATP-binding protein [Methanomicrobiales archaeon]|nr:ABC transporter ATP-binding protein [Methanomicrobiales archaeon]